MSGFSNPVGIICQGEGQQVSGFSNPMGIICQGEGQQVSGFSGESTLGEDFTPRCEESEPEVGPYLRVVHQHTHISGVP